MTKRILFGVMKEDNGMTMRTDKMSDLELMALIQFLELYVKTKKQELEVEFLSNLEEEK